MRNLSTILLSLLLISCVPTQVQPIQTMDDAYIGKMNVNNVYVRLSPTLAGEIRGRITKAKSELKEDQLYLDEINSRRVVGTTTRKKAKEDVANKKQLIARLEAELKNITQDVRLDIAKYNIDNEKANKRVDLNVEINSFVLTNAGEVLFIGGYDMMNATVTVLEEGTRNKMGIYSVTDLDTNGSGGVIAVIARGPDPRGDMIRNFSKKVIDVLYRLSNGKKYKET